MMKKTQRSAPKIFMKAAIAVIALFAVLSLCANAVMVGVYAKKIDSAPDGKKFDCILILGAKVFENGSVSAMLADRLDRGIELYFSGVSDKILCSGDHGTDGYDEVNAMKAYCVSHGVPSEDVFMDHAGFSTYESVIRAKLVFGCRSVMIVTQKYHLYRALYIAGSTGLDAFGSAADTVRYPGQTVREIREYAARCKDIGYVFAGAYPKYLGDAIPITGDGNATNDK